MNNDRNIPLSFALCDVISVDDPSEGQRVKVRIPGSSDADKTIDELQFCFPLLPKHLGVNPKLGEKVIVFFQNPDTKNSFRVFIGPVSMQDYMLSYAPGSFSDGRTAITTTTLSSNNMGPFEAPSRNPENDGSIPKREEITIRGRNNSDVVLGENETRIRCGFMKTPLATDTKIKLNYNPVDSGYIQLKYKPSKDIDGDPFSSSINLVADRINLLSYDSSSYIDGIGEKDLVNDDRMNTIFEKAHVLPYGDELVAFLKEFVRVFKEHTHPFHQKPPCLNEANTRAVSPNFDEMLSKSIRIN